MPSKSQKHCYFHSGDVALMLDSKVVHAAIAVLPTTHGKQPAVPSHKHCHPSVHWCC